MKNKLPKAFKAKWLKALRSGKYEQGTVYLKEGDQYCCLGVACVVAGASHGPYSLYANSKKVPILIRGDSKTAVKLSDMNDQGKTFDEIADYIEKNL